MLLLCSRCGKLVIWMCLRQVSMLCHFCLFLYYVLGVFNSLVATPAHGPSPSLRLRFISENASLLCVFVPTSTVPLHQVVNSGSFLWALSLFIYVRSMSGLSRSYCRWPEWNNIVRSRRSLVFVRSRFTRAHPLQPELPYAIKYFWKHSWYRTESFLKQCIGIEHWIWSPIQWTVPISRIISNER